jgi:hypothetical protein
MNLGLGELVDIETLAQYLEILIARPELRRDMRRRGLDAVRGRSNQRIAERLLEAARDRGAHSPGAS